MIKISSTVNNNLYDFSDNMFTIENGVFVEETDNNNSAFSLYPNPANYQINLLNKRKLSEEIHVNILNMRGESVVNCLFHNQNPIQIDVGHLSAGLYILKIQTNTGLEIKKLAIQR